MNPAGGEARIAYDREDSPVHFTDEQGNVTRFRYNGTGMLTACETPDGATLGYQYDPEDRLLAVINQNGQALAIDPRCPRSGDDGKRLLGPDDALRLEQRQSPDQS